VEIVLMKESRAHEARIRQLQAKTAELAASQNV
jgi:hypothetical protein